MSEETANEIIRLAELQGDWKTKLILSKDGAVRPLLANAITALRHAAEWRDVLRFDEFGGRAEANAAPPWAVGDNNWKSCPWEGADDIRCAEWLQLAGISVSADVAAQAVEIIAQEHAFHPVRDYLDGLEWDGKLRAETLAPVYLGAEDTSYTRAVSQRFLIGAIARIYSPGAKVDTCLILEGSQGTLKSTSLRTLAHPWFSDEIADIGSKDAAMQMRGVWIIELSELDSMSRAEISRVKAFLSRSADRFRPPYGRRVIEAPRQCVLAGTTNSAAYLKDETGGRRFWPIKCGRIDIEALARDRDQLWAEARMLYQQGKTWWLDTRELIDSAGEEQDQRYDADPWTAPTLDHLAARTETTVSELLRDAIGLSQEKWTRSDQMRVSGILKKSGWERYQVRKGDVREWRYRKAENEPKMALGK